MIDICEAGQSDLPEIMKLYAEAGYGAAINPADTVVVAKSFGQVAGVVRLCPEEGVTVLRGMQIKETFQRQGIGARMLLACEPYLEGRQSFCLPYAHLVAFYGTARFVVAGKAALPEFLAQRLSLYSAQGKDILAMRRDA